MGYRGTARPKGRFDVAQSSKVRGAGGGGFIPIRRGYIKPPSFDVSMTGSWSKAVTTLIALAKRYEAAINRATKEEAQFFQNMIVKGLRTQHPGDTTLAPPRESTLARRRAKGIKSIKSLIATEEMMRAIRTHKIANHAYFVGIPSSAFGSDGRQLSIVAQQQEEGVKGKIAARPFFQPIMDKYGKPADVKARFEARIQDILLRDLGFSFFGNGVLGIGFATKSKQSGRSKNVGMTP